MEKFDVLEAASADLDDGGSVSCGVVLRYIFGSSTVKLIFRATCNSPALFLHFDCSWQESHKALKV